MANPQTELLASCAPGWKPNAKTYQRKSFVEFCVARQAVLQARRDGKPRPKWTDDPVLQQARFCNIDRRDDAVTAELIVQWEVYRANWTDRERVLLAAALRFTGSRRGEAESLAALIEAGREKSSSSQKGTGPLTPLCEALDAARVRCGTGTYQLSLNRKQVASKIEEMATAVVDKVGASGPFADVREASDFVAEAMTVGKRPQFSANETAKDLAYIGGLMLPASHQRCRLGPGAVKGLALLRKQDDTGAGPVSALSGDAEEAVAALRSALRARASLSWVESIDVEQALCEYSKYVAYCEGGISAMKRFVPTQSTLAAEDGMINDCQEASEGAPSSSQQDEAACGGSKRKRED